LARIYHKRAYENKEKINTEEKKYMYIRLFYMDKMNINMFLLSDDQVFKGKIKLNIFVFTAISTISTLTKAPKLLIRH